MYKMVNTMVYARTHAREKHQTYVHILKIKQNYFLLNLAGWVHFQHECTDASISTDMRHDHILYANTVTFLRLRLNV